MPIWAVKYLIITLVIAGIIWGCITWRKHDIQHWKDAGRQEVLDEIAIARQKADEATHAKQSKIRNKTQKVENEILSDKSGDRPISPVIARQLKRMRAEN